MDIDKVQFLDDKLNEIFVEKYEVIKKSVDEINTKLVELNVEFTYSYDEFCLEYKQEMVEIVNDNPEIELNDVTLFMLSHSILLKMLTSKKAFFTTTTVNTELF